MFLLFFMQVHPQRKKNLICYYINLATIFRLEMNGVSQNHESNEFAALSPSI